MRSRSDLTAPASQALAAGSPRVLTLRRGAPGAVPDCYPYGVRAMWSERSRHMRGGAVTGGRRPSWGPVVRLLALLCVSWHVT